MDDSAAQVDGSRGGSSPVEARTAFIVINEAAGPTTDNATLAERVRGAFAAQGWTVRMASCQPAALSARLSEACAQAKATPGAIFVVGGGDGTIRTAAGLALEHGVALGILAMGTMNLLPKDLRLPLEVVKAAEAIATGRERRIDVGRVNGRIFLHSSVLGVVPLLGEEREKFRTSRTLRERLSAVWRGIRHAFTTPRITLTVERGAKSERVRTFSLAVSNNLLSDRPGEAFLRSSLDGGHLAVYLSKHTGRLGLFMLLATIGSGRWALDRQMEAEEVTRVRITARRRFLAVSNDGEVERLSVPLNYTLARKALRVVTPCEAPAAATASPGPA